MVRERCIISKTVLHIHLQAHSIMVWSRVLDKLFRGDALIYDGEFAHGLYEGQGKLREDDKLYDGAFVAGLYEGMGKLYKNGALMYEGEFAAGLYNGVGTEYNPETGY